MNFKHTPLLSFCAAILLTLAACGNKDAAMSAPSANEIAAAKVNGVTISEASLRLLAKERGENADDASIRKAIIDRLVVQHLLSEEALAKGIDKTPEVSIRVELNRRGLLATAFAQDYLKSHPIGEEALKAQYAKIKAMPHGIESKVRHIMLTTEAEAKDVIAKLKKDPKSFDALARARTKDEKSRDKGGDLGWSQRPTENPEFDLVISKMTKGQFTETPVKTYWGWHVLWLEDQRERAPATWEQVQPGLKHQAEQEALLKFIEETKAKAKIEIVPTTPAPTEKK